MSDEDSVNDELEDSPVEGEEEVDEMEDAAADGDDASFSSSSPGKAAADEIEALEDFSIASRQKARDELESQIAEFLARGGKINQVEPNVTADPPKKPTSDYGGRPI
jgi:hypothetical protein